MNILMSFHLFILGYISLSLSNNQFAQSKKEKNQHFATTSKSHKLVQGKLYDSILLGFELTDL